MHNKVEMIVPIPSDNFYLTIAKHRSNNTIYQVKE